MVFEKSTHVHPRLHIGQGKSRGFCRGNTSEFRFFVAKEESLDTCSDLHDCCDKCEKAACVPFNVSSRQALMHNKSLGNAELVFGQLFISSSVSGSSRRLRQACWSILVIEMNKRCPVGSLANGQSRHKKCSTKQLLTLLSIQLKQTKQPILCTGSTVRSTQGINKSAAGTFQEHIGY